MVQYPTLNSTDLHNSSTAPLRGGPAREAELLRATLEVLRETGYDRLTVDAVVASARASKQTVYRRWQSKADLVVAAFIDAVADPVAPQDTGSLREDLLALLNDLLDELAGLADVIVGLIGELRHNRELATAMQASFLNARRQLALDVFVRARARGEIAGDVDVELLWEVAPAILFFRVLLTDEPIDKDLTRRLVNDVVMPLTRAGS